MLEKYNFQMYRNTRYRNAEIQKTVNQFTEM